MDKHIMSKHFSLQTQIFFFFLSQKGSDLLEICLLITKLWEGQFNTMQKTSLFLKQRQVNDDIAKSYQ